VPPTTATQSRASARDLLSAGKLDEAIDLLGAELRDQPADAHRRTFLFELLCFAGKYDRAEKQLDVLAQGGRQSEMGALLYRSALHAERTRQSMFQREEFPSSSGARTAVGGTINGQRFESIRDADPRVGPRLEVFAAGQYMWLPFEHIASIRMEPPKQLRDLLWARALVRTGPSFRGLELGEVLVPVLTPLAWQDDDSAVRLGRVTEWYELPGGVTVPAGQRVLVADDAETSLLEVREIVIDSAPTADD
jgi:type VI secretion system protein ImpE